MSYQLLLLLSVLPSIILGFIVYQKDKVEKEPKKLLIRLLIGGIGAAILTVTISYIIEIIFPHLKDSENLTAVENFLQILLEIALVEESCKWYFLKKLTWNNKEFNYLYDAIVYAVFVSLGFATIENILYVFEENSLSIAIIRAIFSVPGHAFFGVFMGYYYGLSKLAEINKKENIKRKNMILSLIVPVTLHFIFDYCLLEPTLEIIGFYLIFIVILYIKAFKKINQLSKITESMIKEEKPRCPNCNHEINGAFCSNCGTKIEK